MFYNNGLKWLEMHFKQLVFRILLWGTPILHDCGSPYLLVFAGHIFYVRPLRTIALWHALTRARVVITVFHTGHTPAKVCILVLDFESEWTKETIVQCSAMFCLKLLCSGTYIVHLQAERAGSESLRPSSREP